MLHTPSEGGPFGDVNPKVEITRGVRLWPLLYGLIAMLAFGPFSIAAAAQGQGLDSIVHGEGTAASARFIRLTSATNTFMYIFVSRDAQKQGADSTPNVTTHVTYGVCVLNNTTDIQICQNGDGTIANNELSGDVNYGLGGPPESLALNFNSATEPGYQLSATECDENTQPETCSSTTPIGGVVDMNWSKNDYESITSTGTSEERYFGKLTVKSVGHSAYFSSYASGSILGMYGIEVSGFPLNELGTVRNMTLTFTFRP